jgi:hypothetical protein
VSEQDFMLELHGSLAGLERSVRELVREQAMPIARTEDVDLTVQNPAPAVREMRAEADEAIQVDNPYAVMLEVRHSADGGGEVIMRVPPFTSRVLPKKVGPISLRALGAPVGATPATVTRFDRPVPPGVYDYSQAAGEPIAARYVAAAQTLLNGMESELQLDAKGMLRVGLLSTASIPGGSIGLTVNTPGDGTGNGANGAAYAIAQGLMFNGNTWDRVRTASVFKQIAAVAVVAGTPQTIWTPAAGKKFRLMGWYLWSSVVAAGILKDAGAEIGLSRIVSPNGNPSPPLGNGYLSAAANNALQLDAAANSTWNGFVFGTEE